MEKYPKFVLIISRLVELGCERFGSLPSEAGTSVSSSDDGNIEYSVNVKIKSTHQRLASCIARKNVQVRLSCFVSFISLHSFLFTRGAFSSGSDEESI